MEELPLHTNNAATSAFWRGKNYEALRQEECQEILWELAEVNFCCEFKALHRRTIDPNVQNLPIMRCFPDGDHLPGQLDIGAANYGLADPLWLHRAPYIFAMKKAMQTWEDMPPSLLSEVRMAGWTEKEFLLVEKRWPIIIVIPSGKDYVPETRPQMTTSRSGVYVDVEELS
ncbi:hypothetical protein IW261DRAFT_1572105 [Armillaria novae-zelandiae]|uniref:Uncharacterized protein n=1 Tax=Armillaria novae-zelandiae TaxID=153914 RepID=A0AA39NT75_9AGAR|nr:hypothetical protein IW261DRAFT_1572105 [Armillaria novae-zelandiae]